MKYITTLLVLVSGFSAFGQSTFMNYIQNPDSNQFTIIGQNAHQLFSPIDLAFHPFSDTRPDELWVLNQGTFNSGGHTVIIRGATTESQTYQTVKDGNAWHFMAMASAMDFNPDAGTWATSQDIQDANRQGGTFTGPTLWSSDLNVYGVIGNPATQQYNGSHLDMVHQTPYGKGIAHEKDNVYWVFDGWAKSITRYDFVDDHGPGQHYHGDALVHVFNEITVEPDASLPSHMVIDKANNWLYVCHTDGGEIIRVDITKGERNVTLPKVSNEALADYASFKNAVFETIISTGLQKPVGIHIYDGMLLVTDNASGEIVVYDMENPGFPEMGRITIGYPNSDIMGITVGPDGMIYYTDYNNRRVVRIDNSSVFPVGVEEVSGVTMRLSPNPATYGTAQVSLTGHAASSMITLTDLTGRALQHIAVNGRQTVALDLAGMAAGMYIVSLSDPATGARQGSTMLVME